MSRRIAALVAAVAMAGATAGEARAQAGDTTTVVRACVKKKGGQMRMLLKGTKCRRGERLVSWNAIGVRALPGAKGDPGPQGPKGDPGDPATINGVAAGGHLTGTYPNPMIADGAVGAAQIAAALLDGPANQATLRSIGPGATQVVAGNDPRLINSRAPSGAAGGDLTGTYPDPTLAAGTVGAAEIADGTVGQAELGLGSVDSARVIDNTLSNNDIAASAIGSDELGFGSVRSAEVANNTLAGPDIFRTWGSYTIDFPEIAAHSCWTEYLTVTNYGAPDSVLVFVPQALDSRLIAGNTYHPNANFVPVRLCNLSAAPVNPLNMAVRVGTIGNS